ncbi:hypothetical protein tb265_00350 [Gemmatimonadetes bacterium T265]|nr:hypothetical protein tb265_00350 [Gemmatimonadetes bacterium T265]
MMDESGDVHWLQGAYTALRDAQLGREQVEALREQLRDARRRHAPARDVVADVAAITPGFASFLRHHITPDNQGATWSTVGAVLTILAFWLQHWVDPPAMLPDQVIVNITVERVNDSNRVRSLDHIRRPPDARRAGTDPRTAQKLERAEAKRARKANRRRGG